MYKISGTKIVMTRGDTVRVRFPLTIDDEEYTPVEGDTIRFAINTLDHESSNPLVVKDIPIDTMILTLEPEDTKDLDFDTYYYDVQITFAESGDVITYIEKAKLVLTWEAD